MNILDILAAILDNPAIQEPAAEVVAKFLKAKLPTVAEKDLGDFLTLVANKLLAA